MMQLKYVCCFVQENMFKNTETGNWHLQFYLQELEMLIFNVLRDLAPTRGQSKI